MGTTNYQRISTRICADKLAIFLTLIITLIALSFGHIKTLAAALGSNQNMIDPFIRKDNNQLFKLNGTDYSMLGLPNSDPVGNHDGIEGIVGFGSCKASGWAVDPDHVASDVTVRILSDSSTITTTVADQYREDLTGICTGGTCGFSVWLWELITPGAEHQITVQAQDLDTDSWVDLGGTPKSLTCWGYPAGVHDGSEGIVGISECNAFGWAFDPDDYSRDVTVLILSDGITTTTAIADGYRGDINPVFCPEGTCGFSVDLWGLISPRVEHQILAQVYDQETDSWIDLDTVSKSLTCMGYLLYLPSLLNQP